MGMFLLRRFFSSVVILFGATFIMYILTAYSGDPLEDLTQSTARNKEELIARRKEILQLDVPPYLRYFLWLGGVLKIFVGQIDLGQNINGLEVTELLAIAAVSTLTLVTTASIISIFLGVMVGIVTALRQYSRFDYTVTFTAFLFFSLPVFWVAVLLKQYGAIGFNDFLADPQIPPLWLALISLVSGFIWMGIVGGDRTKKIGVFLIATAATAITLITLLLTNWFESPGIGMFTGLLLGVGAAFGITAISTGLSNVRARNASLVVVAIGMVVWIPFNMLSSMVSGILFFVLALVTVLVGIAVGWFMGGEDKAPVARTSAITAFVMGGIVAIDRFMQAWKPYTDSSYISGRPIATIGSETPNLVGSFWVEGIDAFTHLLLPTVALLLIGFAGYTRYARASLLEVLNQDYIRTARAKGLTERTVIMRHAFRNALIPLTTLVAFDFAAVIGGAVITERVFAWSGMGNLFISSLSRVDLNPVMGFFLITGTLAIFFNIVADLVYTLLDPRIRVNA
jgi:peptide/nickel transport system permease protein